MDQLYSLLTQGRLLDCSHLLHRDIPTWPGDIDFYRCPLASYSVSGYFKEYFILPEGFGTHMDSPGHFFEGQRTTSEIGLKEMVTKGVVVDVTEKCSQNADYELQVEDVTEWEMRHGKVPEGALVCMRTGWSLRFSDVQSYRNADVNSPHTCYPGGTMHFPGFSQAVAEFLCKERSIVGIGIDTLSLDPGISTTFPVHQVILGSDKYQLENMKLEELPESGAVLVILPLKIKGAVESPVRVLGIVP